MRDDKIKITYLPKDVVVFSGYTKDAIKSGYSRTTILNCLSKNRLYFKQFKIEKI